MSEKVELGLKEKRYHSRIHYKEEKKKQRREWRKRRREERVTRKRGLRKAGISVVNRQSEKASIPNREVHQVPVEENEREHEVNEVPQNIPSKRQGEEVSGAAKKRRVDPITVSMVPVPVTKDKNASEDVESMTRGRKMVALAKFKRPDSSAQNPSKRVYKRVSSMTTENTREKQRSAARVTVLREIDRSLVVKIRSEPIGSGTFGNCFLADYRGITAVVKEMKKRNATLKESERCKKEVLHEGSVLHSLGDHKSLPFLLGICTDKEPYAVVTQFHGSGQESLTLYKAIKEKLLNKTGIVKTFASICEAVTYVHGKGYLHNDLKANNVVLKRENGSFHPMVIDFGKSKPIEKSVARKRYTNADYIAPEVRNGRHETTASDVYSVGKMLERAVYGRSFEVHFKNIIAQTTQSSHWRRPSFSELIYQLNNVIED